MKNNGFLLSSKCSLVLILFFLSGINTAEVKATNPYPQDDIVSSIKKLLVLEDCASINTISDQISTVIDFGATPNDNTDDSEAFQKMLDSNKDLLIPAGTYNINKSLQIQSKRNLKVYGVGLVKLISKGIRTSNVFKISGSTGVLISNIIFIGGTNKLNIRNIAIDFSDKNSSYIGIFNCTFTGNSSQGFNIGINAQYGGEAFLISDCTFNSLVGNISGNGYGIHIASVTNSKICNNNFSASKGRGRHAIYLSTGVQNCKVLNNNISNFDWASIALNCYTYEVENKDNLIKNNVIRGGGDMNYWGVGQISVFGKCWNNTIESNKLYNGAKMGIFINGNSGDNFDEKNISTGNKVINNTIENCGTYGITVSGAKNLDLIGNKIQKSEIARSANQSYPGIYITANLFNKVLPSSHDIVVKGNQINIGDLRKSPIFIEKGVKIPYNIKVN